MGAVVQGVQGWCRRPVSAMMGAEVQGVQLWVQKCRECNEGCSNSGNAMMRAAAQVVQ